MKKGVQRRIELLHPEMQKRVKKFLQECKSNGVNVSVIETLRTTEVQQAYFSQGREHLEDVNEKRRIAGLYEISEKENKKIITNCDGIKNKSNHQAKEDGFGYAVDIVPVDDKARPLWNARQEVWELIGYIAETCGLDWCAGGYGQTWGKGWDNPHFEYVPE